jgi:transposase
VATERIEIITGTGRRKNWTPAERAQLLREAFSERGAISRVARQYGICRSLLYRWRRQAGPDGDPVNFVPVRIAESPREEAPIDVAASGHNPGLVEILLSNGRLVRVAENIAPRILAGLMAALDRR